MDGNAIFQRGTGGKVGSKLEKLFPRKSGAVVPILPWKDRTPPPPPPLHILEKIFKKCQSVSSYNFNQ